jgi:hypothetical protein
VQLHLIYQTVFGTWFLDLANACLNRTESAKTTADNLKNPLGGFDEYSKLLNELIKKKSSTSSKHHDVLSIPLLLNLFSK